MLDTNDIGGSNPNDNPMGRITREPMKPYYAYCLEDLVVHDPSNKPKAALQQFRTAFPLSGPELVDKKIATKVSSIKIRLKKRNMYTTPTKRRKTQED